MIYGCIKEKGEQSWDAKNRRFSAQIPCPSLPHFIINCSVYARQHSKYRDLRHLKALVWMINGLICSGKINLSQWESYVPSRATKAQSTERRWVRLF